MSEYFARDLFGIVIVIVYDVYEYENMYACVIVYDALTLLKGM